MAEIVCAICKKRISNWLLAAGKCRYVNNHLVCPKCLTEHTIEEIVKKLKGEQ